MHPEIVGPGTGVTAHVHASPGWVITVAVDIRIITGVFCNGDQVVGRGVAHGERVERFGVGDPAAFVVGRVLAAESERLEDLVRVIRAKRRVVAREAEA